MDQSKSPMALIKKHYFWILLVITLISGVAVSFLATAAVDKKTSERKTALDSLKSDMGTIGSNQTHPNPGTIEELEKIKLAAVKDVMGAWKEQHDNQVRRNEWPKDLGNAFLNMIRNKKPGDTIPPIMCGKYQYFIDQHYPVMLEMINRRHVEREVFDFETKEPKLDANGEVIWEWVEDIRMLRAASESTGGYSAGGYGEGDEGSGSGGGYGGSGAGMGGYGSEMGGMGGYGSEMGGMGGYGMGGDEMGGYGSEMGGYGSEMGGDGTTGGTDTRMPKMKKFGLVEWPLPEFFRITAGWQTQSVPTSDQVWQAQEDLWVYEALIRVIGNTNGNATSHFKAPIKRIIALDIGPSAMGAFMDSKSQVFGGPLGMSSMMGEDMMYGDGMDGSDPYGMGGGYGEDGEMGMGSEMAEPPRYIDDEGNPILPGTEPPFTEFKMMPVRMQLMIDQDKIPTLLANCANCSMPIDVKMWRFNPGMGRPIDLSPFMAVDTMAMDDEGMMGGEYGSEYGPMGSGMGSGYGEDGADGYGEEGMGSGVAMPGQNSPYGAKTQIIELLGVIYIFAEPDVGILGQGAGSSDMVESVDLVGEGNETLPADDTTDTTATDTTGTDTTGTGATGTATP